MCRSCPLCISYPHRFLDIALIAAMEPAFGPLQSSPAVLTIPEDEEVEHEATIKQGKSQQGTIGACDACRMRKVRCLANEDSRSSKCQRCARASRECVRPLRPLIPSCSCRDYSPGALQKLMTAQVYTTHSKTRRRKRTDTRVKELEQRVAEMSFLLEHRRSSSTPSSVEKEDDAVDTQAINGDIGGVYSFSNSSLSPGASTKDDPCVSHGKQQGLSQNFPMSNRVWEQSTEDPEPTSDVIDRGILNLAKATELYNRYLDALLPQYPAVPLRCTMAELRLQKPTLFLAVLAASSGASDPSLNRRLNLEIHRVYARKISIQGLKSLELVQSLLVSILWTYPPEKFEDVKFHQQINMAATMALDLGLAKKPKGSPMGQQPSKVPFARQHPDWAEDQRSTRFPDGAPLDVSYEAGTTDHVMAPKMHLPDSGSLESRRTLLACYLFCASVSMSLRLPNFLRYSSWMADCSEALRTSPDAAPTDKRFVAWVQLQRLVEECGTSFALDSPDNTVSLADERTQLMLQSYEKQMGAWRQHALTNDNIMNR